MSEEFKNTSRSFLCLAAMMIVAAPLGMLGCVETKRAEPTRDTKPVPGADTPGPISTATPVAAQRGDDKRSPIFGVTIPDGYRKWELIAPSQNPSDLKGIFGNETAMKAYRDGKLPFPDGSTLVKLTWKREPLDGFDGAFVPGPATMVQVMVKDSKKYTATGGWGFGRYIDGKPVDEAQHKTCFACHSRNTTVKEHDFVFTLLAP